MSSVEELLAVVPARKGSKTVPRKNMRLLGGRPLIAYTVDAILGSGVPCRLVVSSDDEEILSWAEIRGYEVDRRPAELATDSATISAVAAHVADELDWNGDVGVFQPTSPLRSASSIAEAVKVFRSEDVDSLASAVRVEHLLWRDAKGDLQEPEPLFQERVNRQFARHEVLRETGAIQLVRGNVLRTSRQIVGQRHMLFELEVSESLDIDTQADLATARATMRSETVVFRLRANRILGTGHLYHCLQLAQELDDQTVTFLLKDCEPFVAELIETKGYSHREETDLVSDLGALAGPGENLVVNDVLDTTEREVLLAKAAGFKVVNVEDLGPGTRHADWVVNALYPLKEGVAGDVSWGPRYATLRPEFHDLPDKVIRDRPERVLISFGGGDPTRLAERLAALLAGGLSTEIRVILGPAAEGSEFPSDVTVLRSVDSMAAEMLAADVILTSAGRTVYEAAATGTPVVVLAQNAREATHAHLTYDHGVVFLGLGRFTEDDHVLHVVRQLLEDPDLRSELSERLRGSIDFKGTERIASRVRQLLRES